MRNYKLILILLLALFLRLNYDIFVDGYNFDEIAIMSTAVQSFPFGILKTAATNDYHAPLYQLIVHFFTYLDNEWVYIRLFNLIISIINIYIFYKIGVLIKNKNTGYLTALVFTVNHLAVSTVSFVKFYALAFLLISLSIYYFIKILKYDKGHNKLGAVNALLILTSTYGFIFAFFEYLYLIIKKSDKKLYKSIIIALIGFLLYLPVLLLQIKLNHTNILSPHSYYIEFAPLSLYDALNDYFAPCLNYCCNLETIMALTLFLQFIETVKAGNTQIHYLIEFIIFSIIPVAIALSIIFIGIKNNKMLKQINVLALVFIIAFIIMTKLELTGFVPIYTYPAMLILLLSLGVGVSEIKNKTISITLFSVYIFINLFISNCYPPNKRGYEAPKLYNCFEQFYKDNGNVKLITTSGGRFLKKYYKDKNIIEFDNEKMSGNFQKDYIALIYGEDIANKINKKNAYNLIKPIILNKYKNPEFEKYFIENVYNKLQKNEDIYFAFSAESETTFIEIYDNYSKWLKEKPYNYHLSKATLKQAMTKSVHEVDTSVLSEAIGGYSYEYLIELLDKYFKRISFCQYTRTNNDKWIKNYEDFTEKYSTLYLAQNTYKGWIFVHYKKL